MRKPLLIAVAVLASVPVLASDIETGIDYQFTKWPATQDSNIVFCSGWTYGTLPGERENGVRAAAVISHQLGELITQITVEVDGISSLEVERATFMLPVRERDFNLREADNPGLLGEGIIPEEQWPALVGMLDRVPWWVTSVELSNGANIQMAGVRIPPSTEPLLSLQQSDAAAKAGMRACVESLIEKARRCRATISAVRSSGSMPSDVPDRMLAMIAGSDC